MKLNYDSYLLTSEREWYDIVKEISYCNFFHSPMWIKILNATFNYRNVTRVYEIEDKKILIPLVEKKKFGFRFYSSLPFGYGGFIHESNISPEICKKILLDLVKGRVLRLNIIFPPTYQTSIVENENIHRIISEWDYTHILNLTDNFKEVFSRFNENTKKVFKKRTDIEIINENTLENIHIFYNLYAQETKKWGYKDPPHPLKFYENFSRFGSPNIQVRLAKKEDVFIGGIITFLFGTTVFVWQTTFLSQNSKDNSTRYLFFDAIEQACKDGYKQFNFGASGNYQGTRIFKEGFGARRVNVDSYRVLSKLGAFIN